jgi:hypothetical protein
LVVKVKKFGGDALVPYPSLLNTKMQVMAPNPDAASERVALRKAGELAHQRGERVFVVFNVSTGEWEILERPPMMGRFWEVDAKGGAIKHNPFSRSRIADPREFHKKSFRTITPGSGAHKLVVGCPKGHPYVGGRCGGGMEVQSVMTQVNPSPAAQARPIVQEVLRMHGLSNKFRISKTSFSGFGYGDGYFVTIEGWKPDRELTMRVKVFILEKLSVIRLPSPDEDHWVVEFKGPGIVGNPRRNIAFVEPSEAETVGEFKVFEPRGGMIATGTYETGVNWPPFQFVEAYARKGKFGLIAFGAYNAFGLIGPEQGGVALVAEKPRKQVIGTLTIPYSRKKRLAMFKQIFSEINWPWGAKNAGFEMRYMPNPGIDPVEGAYRLPAWALKERGWERRGWEITAYERVPRPGKKYPIPGAVVGRLVIEVPHVSEARRIFLEKTGISRASVIIREQRVKLNPGIDPVEGAYKASDRRGSSAGKAGKAMKKCPGCGGFVDATGVCFRCQHPEIKHPGKNPESLWRKMELDDARERAEEIEIEKHLQHLEKELPSAQRAAVGVSPHSPAGKYYFDVLRGIRSCKRRLGINPGPGYHRREEARYKKLLRGDLKAGHRDAAEYWQGALSSEAASVAAGGVVRNPTHWSYVVLRSASFDDEYSEMPRRKERPIVAVFSSPEAVKQWAAGRGARWHGEGNHLSGFYSDPHKREVYYPELASEAKVKKLGLRVDKWLQGAPSGSSSLRDWEEAYRKSEMNPLTSPSARAQWAAWEALRKSKAGPRPKGGKKVSFMRLPAKFNANPLTWFHVYLGNKLIDAIPVGGKMTAEAVRRSLIEHDGYDHRIRVVKTRDYVGKAELAARASRNPGYDRHAALYTQEMSFARAAFREGERNRGYIHIGKAEAHTDSAREARDVQGNPYAVRYSDAKGEHSVVFRDRRSFERWQEKALKSGTTYFALQRRFVGKDVKLNPNDEERRLWVLNDEGLYNMQQQSGLSTREFIKQNRALIDEVIANVTGHKKPAHYLAYGPRGNAGREFHETGYRQEMAKARAAFREGERQVGYVRLGAAEAHATSAREMQRNPLLMVVPNPKPPSVDDIMRYENGEMSETEALKFFSKLIRSGMVNQLQGSYGRTAAALIKQGLLSPDGRVHSLAQNPRGLGVPEQHQLRIALRTLKMTPAMAAVMGGMSIPEAKAFLKRVGYSDQQIAKLAQNPKRKAKKGKKGKLSTLAAIAIPTLAATALKGAISTGAGIGIKAAAAAAGVTTNPSSCDMGTLMKNPRFAQAVKLYRKFHGCDPKSVKRVLIPIGDKRRIDGREFFVSLGKAPSEAYDPPSHSGKAGSIFVHPYERKPEKVVSADGKTIVTLPGSHRVTDWIRG